MKRWVTEYIKGCAMCQANKPNTHPNRPAIFPIIPKEEALPFQTIAIDWITKLPVSEGFDSIMTITDHDCSKAAIFIPCNKTLTAEGLVGLYARHVFPYYGVPKKLISD